VYFHGKNKKISLRLCVSARDILVAAIRVSSLPVLVLVLDASSPNGSVITHGMVIPGQARNDGIRPDEDGFLIKSGMTE
jgi:hypothetical protein